MSMRNVVQFRVLAGVVAALVACSDDAADGAGGGGSDPTGASSSSAQSSVASSTTSTTGAGGEGGAPPSGPTSIPSYFRLTGEAAGIDRGVDVSCALDFIFELDAESLRTETMVEYPGTHGGSASRTVLDQNGDGISLSPSVFGDVVARLTFEGSALEIEIPINATSPESFWQELAYFPGTLEPDGTGSGTWTCAPFDLDQEGYVDLVGTVEGTWTIEPIDR